MLGLRFWLLSVGTTCAIIGVALGQFAIERHGWVAKEGVILATKTTCEIREVKIRVIPTATLADEIDCDDAEAYQSRYPNTQWSVLRRPEARVAVDSVTGTPTIGEILLPTAIYPDPKVGDVVPLLQNPADPTKLYVSTMAWINWPSSIFATLLALVCFYHALGKPRWRSNLRSVRETVAPASHEPVIQDASRQRRGLERR